MTTARTNAANGASYFIALALLSGLTSFAMPTSVARAQAVCPETTKAEASLTAWIAAPGGKPLTGSILANGQTISAGTGACAPTPTAQLHQAMAAHLADGGVLLLGEVHDNGAQHALRAAFIRDLAADLARRGRPAPALVFEHLTPHQIDKRTVTTSAPADTAKAAEAFLKSVEWEKSGWPPASLFMPIFEAAIANGLPILSGNAERSHVRDVAMRGLSALSAAEVERLKIDTPLPDPLASALLDELEASHCGLMPRVAFNNMALAQRYRDSHLAASLTAAAERHGSAILLAGNGHVRADRAAPWDFARLAPSRKVMTVMLIEIEDVAKDAAAYVPRDPSDKPAADYVILTPRAERPDPCEAMRARFKKK